MPMSIFMAPRYPAVRAAPTRRGHPPQRSARPPACTVDAHGDCTLARTRPGPGSLAGWLRHGDDRLATARRGAATSALGTYAIYAGYGLLHPRLLRALGDGEASMPLPGDALVPAPDSAKTFAIDIDAPPAAVWPYLLQMGYGRAGWYGWYPMENGGGGSADAVLAEWQGLAVGDRIPDGPRADEGLGVWRVVELVAPATLVLYSRRVAITGRERAADEPTIECSWAFVVRATPTGARLIVRVRSRFVGLDEGLLGRVLRGLFDVGDTVMEHAMIAGIARRAEGDARSS
jgi:hypothetical protein